MEPIQTVPYHLVLLRPAKRLEGDAHFAAHVSFIEEMSAANVVLLGGDFEDSIDGADGAYLLHTASPAEAEDWAARDPLISSGAYSARVVPWHLVGIAPAAIDPRLLEAAATEGHGSAARDSSAVP